MSKKDDLFQGIDWEKVSEEIRRSAVPSIIMRPTAWEIAKDNLEAAASFTYEQGPVAAAKEYWDGLRVYTSENLPGDTAFAVTSHQWWPKLDPPKLDLDFQVEDADVDSLRFSMRAHFAQALWANGDRYYFSQDVGPTPSRSDVATEFFGETYQFTPAQVQIALGVLLTLLTLLIGVLF